MKKKIVMMSIMSSLIVGGTSAFLVSDYLKNNRNNFVDISASKVPEDGDEYDAWLNSWSKPGHVYFHYNRGDKGGYEKFCLWLWNQSKNLEGTLWGFTGNPKVSDTLTLIPMSTSFVKNSDVGVAGADIYQDKFGRIVDVDLYSDTLRTGKSNEAVSFKDCEELGLLWVDQTSMGGKTHWSSDGGREIYVDDFKDEENWRAIPGGKTQHIFFSSGQLSNYSYFAGSGVPQVKINPLDNDELGLYSSKIDRITGNYGNSLTSESFKKLGIGYQIFVASFRDSNGDGYGDIRGIINSLDYLKNLGVDVLWLTPIQQSDSYHGYDISDYYAVDKRFGTIEDYQELLYKAHQKGMKVLMDLVLNHTSKGNVWFTKSQWGVNSGVPGTDTDETGINWRNVYTWKHANDKIKRISRTFNEDTHEYSFGDYEDVFVKDDAKDVNGASWYRDGESNYYYYGKFGSGMPEINYECKDTRKLVTDMAKYWLSFGLDGFRLDAVKHIYMKDEVTDTGNDIIIKDVGTKYVYDDEAGEYIYQPYDYSSDLTKNINWWKEFSNELKRVYPDCFLVGENFDGYGTRAAAYYQGLDSQFDFANYYHIPSLLLTSGADAYGSKEIEEVFNPAMNGGTSTIVNSDESRMDVPNGKRGDFIDGAFTSNHDVMRAINQANASWSDKDKDYVAKTEISGSESELNKAKVHAATTLLHPGISWIYYGDELGMSSNTSSHISTYKNENSMDIWYRQPFVWDNENVRPNYQSGKYVFKLDGYNSKISSKHLGVKESKGDDGKLIFSSDNDMYKWYKALCEIKAKYPDNAKISYQYSSGNVLVMHITGQNAKPLHIYFNIGINQSEYTLNQPNATVIAQIGCSDMKNGSNIGSIPYGLVVFQDN